MKKTILLIIGCFTFSILLVIVLYMASGKINHSKNGFIRFFPPHIISTQRAMDIKFNSYYICGLASEYIYLGNYTAPTYVLMSDYNLSVAHPIRLTVPVDNKIDWETVTITIDSPNVYVIDRVSTSILHGILGSSCILIGRLDSTQFSASIPLSPSSAIIRTYSKELGQDILVKVELNSQEANRKKIILQKQIDGIFSIDGMLRYGPERSHLIYLYFYRNQFLYLDTNLNLIYKAHTIDTNSQAKIKVAQINAQMGTTMSAPPLFVNKESCISRDWLFVNSGLLANNGNKKAFDANSVIDIYSLKDGKYRFSFYLPHYNNKKLSSFSVYNKTLVVLYDHYLVTYHLNF